MPQLPVQAGKGPQAVVTAAPAWPPRSLQRLCVDGPLGIDTVVEVQGPQAHYLFNVLRMKAGDSLLLFDGRSGEWRAEIAGAGRKRVTLRVCEATRPQEVVPDLWLAFAPIKKGPLDWLVEKAVELGVARLIPVMTDRTIVDRLNLDRMRSHIVEAAEQCGRTALAEIKPPIPLATFLDGRDPARRLYFADETGGADPLATVTPGPSVILVGPEGGFTPAEGAAVRGAANGTAISLGPRILRAETAALAAVTTWMACAGDWR